MQVFLDNFKVLFEGPAISKDVSTLSRAYKLLVLLGSFEEKFVEFPSDPQAVAQHEWPSLASELSRDPFL